MQNLTETKPNWISSSADNNAVSALVEEFGLSYLVALILVSRGLTDSQGVDKFLNASLETIEFKAADIIGLPAIADVLAQAVMQQKRVLVFGDFDVDGVSSTALLYSALQELNADVSWIIPSRVSEGYGLTEKVLPRVLAMKPDVVVTVDCGISSAVEAQLLTVNGIELLITDHHEASPQQTPQGVLIADPKLNSTSYGQILSGAGVALALVKLVGEILGKPELWLSYTDLASLGTIADIVPLLDINRALVRAGLDRINNAPRPGLWAMTEGERRNDSSSTMTLSATDLAFGIIPRLNAAGRLGDATEAVEILLTDDHTRASELSDYLTSLNLERRTIEAGMTRQAIAQATKSFQPDSKLVVVAGENWHEGIRGIVASRLTNHFGVPAIVFSLVDSEARGSGRSVGMVNLHSALEAVADITLRYGGHESAVGVTVAAEDIPVFTERLQSYLAELSDDLFQPPINVDAQISLNRLDWQSVVDLNVLEPFGQANPQPIFVTKPARIKTPQTVGSAKNHLSFTADDGSAKIRAIWFNCPIIEQMIEAHGLHELVFTAQADLYRGNRTLQLRVTDAYTPTAATALVSAFPELESGLYQSQAEALSLLDQGSSPLVLMPTGRGKSLIFQLHAARLALRKGAVSIFVYPLRALINDQQRHLLDRMQGI
ncbi:MAG: single-stranded-DNA-specific exonuclease RecJ, partial [Coriobacteriia bacterium]|nr:single-stranded-DNA-specific exonuclease RecJ [Coriobacteriia bacterium]